MPKLDLNTRRDFLKTDQRFDIEDLGVRYDWFGDDKMSYCILEPDAIRSNQVLYEVVGLLRLNKQASGHHYWLSTIPLCRPASA